MLRFRLPNPTGLRPACQRHITINKYPRTLRSFSTLHSTDKTKLPLQSTSSVWERIKQGQFPKSLSKDEIVAPKEFNRWIPVPASFLLQVSIGSVYAWSMWNEPLTRQLGVLVSAADDWTLAQVLPVWSTAAITLGVCTFFLGPWAERAGPRMVGIAAALAYGSGCLLTGLACELHCLPLVYVGYGILGGMGWGLGYISPVSTLMRWFPDRRGLATGLALTAFGAGAAVAAPVIKYLTNLFAVPPTFLGPTSHVQTITQDGRLFVEHEGALREVVVATLADVAQFSTNVAEGVYLVGSGSTGVTGAFAALGLAYFTTMSVGALFARVPHPEWRPPVKHQPSHETPTQVLPVQPTPTTTTQQAQDLFVDHRAALRTPQFYLLWTAVMCNAVAGTCLISSAKSIMIDIFGTLLPLVVTGAFASSYVAMLSLANSAGRLGWSVLSDRIGRRNTYFLFGFGLPICASVPLLTAWATAQPNLLPLALFYSGTLLSFSFYGGLFSTLPAYIADVFGQKHVGAIHGRLLTAWSCAALLGPKLLTTLRATANTDAIHKLAAVCSTDAFENAFGAPVSALDKLIETKTVTINRLMEIAPPGTVDPTPMLYNTTMFGCSLLLFIALICNYRLRVIAPAKMRELQALSRAKKMPELTDLNMK